MFSKGHTTRIVFTFVLVFGALLATTATASAQEDVDPYVEVIDDSVTRPNVDVVTDNRTPVASGTPADGQEVLGATSTRGSSLPLTGAEAGLLVLVGLGMVAAGAVVVTASRRRLAS